MKHHLFICIKHYGQYDLPKEMNNTKFSHILFLLSLLLSFIVCGCETPDSTFAGYYLDGRGNEIIVFPDSTWTAVLTEDSYIGDITYNYTGIVDDKNILVILSGETRRVFPGGNIVELGDSFGIIKGDYIKGGMKDLGTIWKKDVEKSKLFYSKKEPVLPVKFHRFEQFLFDGTGNPEEYRNSTIINYIPDSPDFMGRIHDFTNDAICRSMYLISDSVYHNIDWLEKMLRDAISIANNMGFYLSYDRFYTLQTFDFADYQNRIICNEHELAIDIGFYSLNDLKRNNYVNIDSNTLRLCNKDYIAADCMRAIAKSHMVWGSRKTLDRIIDEGKVLYFIEQTIPNIPDTILFQLSQDQLNWIENNSLKIWNTIYNNQLLDTDISKCIVFLTNTSYANNFRDESISQHLLSYIGLQIVRNYMQRYNIGTHRLFFETNRMKILTKSNYGNDI